MKNYSKPFNKLYQIIYFILLILIFSGFGSLIFAQIDFFRTTFNTSLLILWPIGTFILLFPIIRFIFGKYLNQSDLIILGLFISIIAPGIFCSLPYLLHIGNLSIFWLKVTILVYYFALLITHVYILIKNQQQKIPAMGFFIDPNILTSLFLGLCVYIAIFITFPLLPDADPWGYLVKTRTIAQTGQFLKQGVSDNSRTFFMAWVTSLVNFSPVNSILTIKIIIPIFSLLAYLSFLYSKIRSGQKTSSLIYYGIVFFSIPVVTLSLIVTTPQLIALIYLSALLYFYSNKRFISNPYFNLVVIVATYIISLFHEITLLFIPFPLFNLLRSVWSKYSKNPGKYKIHLLLLGALFLSNLEFFNHPSFSFIYKTITNMAGKISFSWWFISDYKNADGMQMGWPGLQFFLYYGYNLGLTIPWLIIISKKYFIFRFNSFSLYIFAIFMFIAEILPRFGIAYLPDRAWPFVILALLFSINLEELIIKRLFKYLLVGTSCISILVTLGVVYARQGRVTISELPVAEYILSTPKSAYFLGTDKNKFLVYAIGQRQFIDFPELFSTNSARLVNRNWLEKQICILKPYFFYPEITNTSIPSDFRIKINNLLLNNPDPISQTELNQTIDTLKNSLDDLKNNVQLKRSEICNLKDNELYIIYSRTNGSFLYKIRPWWKTSNPLFDPGIYADNKNMEKVYDNGTVIIWKIE